MRGRFRTRDWRAARDTGKAPARGADESSTGRKAYSAPFGAVVIGVVMAGLAARVMWALCQAADASGWWAR